MKNWHGLVEHDFRRYVFRIWGWCLCANLRPLYDAVASRNGIEGFDAELVAGLVTEADRGLAEGDTLQAARERLLAAERAVLDAPVGGIGDLFLIWVEARAEYLRLEASQGQLSR